MGKPKKREDFLAINASEDVREAEEVIEAIYRRIQEDLDEQGASREERNKVNETGRLLAEKIREKVTEKLVRKFMDEYYPPDRKQNQ